MDLRERFVRLLDSPVTKIEGNTVFEKVDKGWRVKDNISTTKLIVGGGILEKGKGAQVGEVREWSGQKYKKGSNGKWSLVVEGKEKSKEEGSSNSKGKLSEPDLLKYAREAKTESLKKTF